MKKGFILFLMVVGFALVSSGQVEIYFEKLAGSKKELEQSLQQVKNNFKQDELSALSGAYYMKLASFESTPQLKLKKFKEGKKLLEEAIINKPNDVNFRLLRLMIQENVPPVLNYKKNITEDAVFLKKNVQLFSKKMKIIYQNYSKKSSALKE